MVSSIHGSITTVFHFFRLTEIVNYTNGGINLRNCVNFTSWARPGNSAILLETGSCAFPGH